MPASTRREGGREEGPGNKAIRWQALAGRHPAGRLCGVYRYQQTCSCMCMIFMASIFGDIRRLTESETLAAVRC